MSLSVLPMFSSKSFIVSGFTFRSLIHFEFIFACAVRECCILIPLYVTVQFFQYHLLQRLSFFIVYSLIINEVLINDHFKLISVYSIRQCSKFTYSWDIQLS